MAYTLNDNFVREQNRIGEKIYARSLNKSPWLKLIPKETWPDGMSDTLLSITGERNLPDDTDTWENVVNDGNGNCVPTEYAVGSGFTERQYTMQRKALVSDNVCVDTTRNAFRAREQTRIMFNNLTRAVAYVWKRKAMLGYTENAQQKMIATHGLPTNPGSFPGVAPTTKLTSRILSSIYENLHAENAAEDGGSLGMVNGRPQYILITDAMTSDDLMRETANKDAFLYNPSRVPELLQPLGVERAFLGFYHMIETLPPRYTFSGGVFTEIAPFTKVATNKGTKLVINEAWRAAPYQDSFVFLPSVISLVVPQPISTQGSKTQWNPQSYMGDFKWLNIQDRTDNPLGTIGFYYALLQCAVKPCLPEFGYVIRHLRCPADLDHTECDETGGMAGSSLLDPSDSFFVIDD